MDNDSFAGFIGVNDCFFGHKEVFVLFFLELKDYLIWYDRYLSIETDIIRARGCQYQRMEGDFFRVEVSEDVAGVDWSGDGDRPAKSVWAGYARVLMTQIRDLWVSVLDSLDKAVLCGCCAAQQKLATGIHVLTPLYAASHAVCARAPASKNV